MSNVFPLPLTAFEKYMVQASWRGDPMLSDCTWHVRGTLHRASFEHALRYALDSNPLFRCRLAWSKGEAPRWVLSDQRDVEVFWDARTAPTRWNDDFELSSEAGIRIWVGPLGDGCSRLAIRYHHALSDGIGIAQFFGDLLHKYSLLRSAPGAAMNQWEAPDLERLQLRGAIAPERSWIARTRAVLDTLRRGKRPVAPLATPSDRAPQPWRAGDLVSDVVSRATAAKLRAHARAQGVTFNDYLLASLFKTLAAWNERHGSPQPTDRLRVMVPTSTRDARHARMPASNCIGFAILDRTATECRDRDALLPGIGRDMREIIERNMGAAFVDILMTEDIVARLRGKRERRRRTRRSSRCATTAILSYMGDAERHMPRGGPRDEHGYPVCGDVTLFRPLGHPPRQDLTRVALSVSFYRGELIMCANADAASLDHAQTMDFLALYKSVLAAGVVSDEVETVTALAAGRGG